MSAVFADTFYFLGLVNRNDQAHTRCRQFWRGYAGALVTTGYILVEVADALAAPAHRNAAARFVRALRASPRVRIIDESRALFERGLELYATRADKTWSLTDCISFVVMGDEQVAEAIIGDHHFEQAGFKILLK